MRMFGIELIACGGLGRVACGVPLAVQLAGAFRGRRRAGGRSRHRVA
jgi:hypothetical protein